MTADFHLHQTIELLAETCLTVLHNWYDTRNIKIKTRIMVGQYTSIVVISRYYMMYDTSIFIHHVNIDYMYRVRVQTSLVAFFFFFLSNLTVHAGSNLTIDCSFSSENGFSFPQQTKLCVGVQTPLVSFFFHVHVAVHFFDMFLLLVNYTVT